MPVYGPTEDTTTKFVEAVKRSALRPERCAWALGHDPEEVKKWMHAGRNAMLTESVHTPYERQCLEFYKRVNRADAEVEEALLDDVRKQTATDWRAAMTLLEKRFPDSWGKASSITVKDMNKLDPSKMTDEELKALILELNGKE